MKIQKMLVIFSVAVGIGLTAGPANSAVEWRACKVKEIGADFAGARIAQMEKAPDAEDSGPAFTCPAVPGACWVVLSGPAAKEMVAVALTSIVLNATISCNIDTAVDFQDAQNLFMRKPS